MPYLEEFPSGLDLQTLEILRKYYAQLNSFHTVEGDNSFQRMKWIEELIAKTKEATQAIEANPPLKEEEEKLRELKGLKNYRHLLAS
jgi:SPX domain protein involved in polyphosphate accumulation